MSEQAIETDEEIEPTFRIEEDTEEVVETEVEEVEASTEDEDDEVEIVLEGEDEPPSKPVRGVRRLINRVNAAKAETSEEIRKREAIEAENALLRARLQQDIEDKEPDETDFETDAEYKAALKDFLRREAKKAAEETARQLLDETRQQTTQDQSRQARTTQLNEHYQRAGKAGITNYDELEGAAIEVMGQDLVEEIAANSDKAHIVIAHLGSRRDKAEEFARQSKINPVKTLLDIGALANSLTVRRKHSRAADPETTITKGIAADSATKGMRFE